VAGCCWRRGWAHGKWLALVALFCEQHPGVSLFATGGGIGPAASGCGSCAFSPTQDLAGTFLRAMAIGLAVDGLGAGLGTP
jgi:hypothetical protein